MPFLFKEGVTAAAGDDVLPGDPRREAARRSSRTCEAFPEAMRLPAARMPRIRSYVSVPVVLSDGTLYGTFCAAGLTSDKELTKRDKALMDVLAHAAVGDHRARVRRAQPPGRDRGPARAGHRGRRPGRRAAADRRARHRRPGRRRGAEPLPGRVGQAPDVCFAEAHSIGLGDRLELLALERAAEHLAGVDRLRRHERLPGHPADPGVQRAARPAAAVDRVLLELSEHDQVEDYDALRRTLAPLRAARHAARHRRRRRRLLLAAAHRPHDPGRHQARPQHRRRRRRRPGAAHARPLAGRLRARLRRHGGRRGRRDRRRRGRPAAPSASTYGQGWHFGRPGPAADLADCPPRATRSASSPRAAAATG